MKRQSVASLEERDPMESILTAKDTADIQEMLMQQLHVTREQLIDEASIMEDLGADSLDLVEIGMNLEERFNLTIRDEEWDRVKTVGDLYAGISELLASAHRGG
jgi:acyl carrier protein